MTTTGVYPRMAGTGKDLRVTQAEQHAALLDYLDAHRHEWAAYLALPQKKRDLMLDRVQAELDAGRSRAAWEMKQALGMPTVPRELCDLPSNQDTRCVQGDEDWTREAAGRLGLSEAQVGELLRPMRGWIFDGQSTTSFVSREAWTVIRLGLMLAGGIGMIVKVRRRPNAPPNSSMVRWTVTMLSLACVGLLVFMFWLAGRR